MTASTITAEDLTNSVAQNIAERLKLNPDKIVTKLVASLTKNLLKSVTTNSVAINNQVKIPQTTVVEKPFDNQVKIPQTTVVQKPLEDLNKTKQPDFSESQESVFEKENKFLFDGFTDKGLNKLKEELPSIIKKGVSDLISGKTEKKADEPAKPGGNLLAGLGILGGIAGLLSLLYGLQTEGPFKGLAKLAGKGLLTVSGFTKMFDGVVKMMLGQLVKLPKTILRTFSKSIGAIFGKGAGVAVFKGGLGAFKGLTNLVPKFLQGVAKRLKNVPIFGALISLGFAVSRLKSGDYVGGGIEVLSGIASLFPGIGTGVSFALDGLNAFLDMKTGGATGKQQGAKLDLLKGMGDWISEKIVMLPIIGPLIKAVKLLAAREWKKGLKQLAYAIPIVDAIAAFMGDEDASDTAKAVAGTFKGVDWSLIGGWIAENFRNVPIIGPVIKAIENFKNGEYLKGFKQLAYVVPIFEMIGGLLGDTEAGTVSTAIGDWGVDLVTDLGKWITDSLAEMVDLGSIKDKIGGALGRAWDSITGADTEEPPPPKKVADAAIDPSGGLVVSSPQEGSLFQLSKNDGVVAAPVAKDTPTGTSNTAKVAEQTYNKSDSILEKIAQNTQATNDGLSNLASGFTALAKALEKMGSAILEKPAPMPTIINQQSGGSQDAKVRSTQAAKAGNSNIANFRQNMEMLRQRPA